MKKLSRFVIKVTSQKQLDIALKFYRRASRRPLHSMSDTAITRYAHSYLYVGMDNRTVNAGSAKYPFEKVIEFNDMALLADTPARKRALVESGFIVEPNKKELPIVQFDYPNREATYIRTRRSVRLIKADANYYIGLEILPDNKFKFKKFLKRKATNVEVLTF